MFDCLFIGSSTKDLLMQVATPPSSDQRITATRKVTACGGPGSTAAVAFSSLGGNAALITPIGDDDSAEFIRADLCARNFSHLDLINIPNAESSFSVIQVEPDGKRCITCYGGCTENLTLSMLNPDLLRQAPMIHLAGLSESFLIDAVQYCKKQAPHALLSVDAGNYSLSAAESILPDIDIFIPDDKTVAKTLGLPPQDACRQYFSKGAKIICITLGDQGSLAYDGSQFYFAPAAKARILDATGAGDNFHGAFLYCLLKKFDLQKTLYFCNAFSALTCEGLGGREALPPIEKVLNKMSEIISTTKEASYVSRYTI